MGQNQTALNPIEIRRDFPILDEVFDREGEKTSLVYLDNAATTQKPTSVLDAIDHYYRHENANVHRGLHQLAERATQTYETSRSKVARFIGASSHREIVFTRGTTESINLVASSWGRKFLAEGDEVLLTEMEHHSNLVPWQILAEERGFSLKFIPLNTDDGTLDISGLDELITDRTKFISVVHMSNVFGTINPVEIIIAKAKERDIPVLLDGAQSAPHMPIDVSELDCDFFCFSSHKMCGPTGIGVLYGKEKWLEEMLPYQGGGEMILQVKLDSSTWNEIPHKFEAGTPNIAGAVGLAAAIDYLENLGLENIFQYEHELTEYALEQLQTIDDIRLFGLAPKRGSAISFYLGTVHPHDVAQFLDRDGVAVRAGHHCAQPAMRKIGVPSTARASFYFYNTRYEVDQLLKSLHRVKEFFHGI